MAVSVWRLGANTIFQKTNLSVVSQKPLFFSLFVTKRFVPASLEASSSSSLRWYVREFTSRVNKKTGSNWLPVCHVRFTGLLVWSTADSPLSKGLNIRSIRHQLLTAAVIRRLICSHLRKTKRFSSDNTILGQSNRRKHPSNGVRFSTGQHFALGTAW